MESNNTLPVPKDLELEQMLLGAALQDNEVVDVCGAYISEHHFFQPLHGRIWQGICDMRAGGTPANPITMRSHFQEDDAFNEVGGLEYLIDLSANPALPTVVEDYAKILMDMYAKRQIIEACEATIQRASSGDMVDTAQAQLGDVIGWSQQVMYELPTQGTQEAAGDAASTVIDKMARGEFDKGIPWGLKKLTEMTGGMIKSNLVVIGGRPSMGKTAFSLMVAKAAAYHGEEDPFRPDKEKKGGALFVSFEMTTKQLVLRQLSDACFSLHDPIPYFLLNQGVMKPGWEDRLREGAKKILQLPLIIDDGAARTVDGVEAASRSADKVLKENGSKLSVVIIDYLGLMTGKRDRNTSRQQEIASITAGLKKLANRLDITVVLLHQVGRGVEARDDKRPQLSDLREAGDVEQDADVVLFVFREHYYLSRQQPKSTDNKVQMDWQDSVQRSKNVMEIIVAKQRNGPTGTADAWVDMATNRIQSRPPTDDDWSML